MGFNYTLDQMDLTGIYETFHPEAVEYILFSNAHGTFSRIYYMLVHKTILKFKRTEIISSPFSDYNGMKLEIKNKNQFWWKIQQYVEIKQHAPKQLIVHRRNQKVNKKLP